MPYTQALNERALRKHIQYMLEEKRMKDKMKKAKTKKDTVDHPSHYTYGDIEVIDAIESWGLEFHLANVVKYVARAKHKGKYLEDLKKARWYLDRKINSIESKE